MRLKKERVKRKKIGNLTLIADKVNIVSPSGKVSGIGQGGGVQAPKRQYQFSYNIDQGLESGPSVTSPMNFVPPSTAPESSGSNVSNALGRIGSILGTAAAAYAGQALFTRAASDLNNWMFNSSASPNTANELVWTPMSQGLSPGTTDSSGTTYNPPPTPRTQRRELLAGAAEGRRADDYLEMAEQMMRRGRPLPPPINTNVARPPATVSTPSGEYVTASTPSPIASYNPGSSPVQGFTPTSIASYSPGSSPVQGFTPSPSFPSIPPSPVASVAGVNYPAIPIVSPQSSPGSVRYPSINASSPESLGSVRYPSIEGYSPGTSPGTVNLASDSQVASAASSANTSPVNVVVEEQRQANFARILPPFPWENVRQPPATLEEAQRMIRDLNNRASESFARGQQSYTVPQESSWPPEILAQVNRENILDYITALGPDDIRHLNQDVIDEFFPSYSGLPAFSPTIPPVYSPYTATPTSPYLPTMYAGPGPEILSSSTASPGSSMSIDSASYRYPRMRGVRPGSLNLEGMTPAYSQSMMGGMQRLGQVIPDVLNLNPRTTERIIERENRNLVRYAEAANRGIIPSRRGGRGR